MPEYALNNYLTYFLFALEKLYYFIVESLGLTYNYYQSYENMLLVSNGQYYERFLRKIEMSNLI